LSIQSITGASGTKSKGARLGCSPVVGEAKVSELRSAKVHEISSEHRRLGDRFCGSIMACKRGLYIWDGMTENNQVRTYSLSGAHYDEEFQYAAVITDAPK